jgi:hypothetical protein
MLDKCDQINRVETPCNVTKFIHSFIRQWLYSLLLGPGLFFSFVIFFTQSAGLLGRVTSPSQGPYLHTGQHKHRINTHTDIHALSRIRTHDPNVRAREDSSCLRLCGHCGRQRNQVASIIAASRCGPLAKLGVGSCPEALCVCRSALCKHLLSKTLRAGRLHARQITSDFIFNVFYYCSMKLVIDDYWSAIQSE